MGITTLAFFLIDICKEYHFSFFHFESLCIFIVRVFFLDSNIVATFVLIHVASLCLLIGDFSLLHSKLLVISNDAVLLFSIN